MTQSGGASVSTRRLRDANPGPLHVRTTLLLTLLLLCPLIAAQRGSTASLHRRKWGPQRPLESPVVVGADTIATSQGIGRRRSDGLSITRSLPLESNIALDAAVDDQAITFTPPRVDLGRMETCTPERYYVGVTNGGSVSVTLDWADFTHEGFSLAHDVRGIRLDPGDRFNVQFVFLPHQVESNGVDAHMRLRTTLGLFSLPIRSSEVALNRYNVRTVRASIAAGKYFEQSLQFKNPSNSTIRITEVYASKSFAGLKLVNDSDWIPRWQREGNKKKFIANEVLGQYDKEFGDARRAGRGVWDMPAGTTSPLISVSVQTDTLGVHLSYVHIVANDKLLLLVPVRITVLKPGIHIEPEEVDLGMLTDFYENEARELFFSLYNADSYPVEILALKVLESKLIIAAQLQGPAVISPQTRAHRALAVQLRFDRDIIGGSCIASLLLKTNASSPELRKRKLHLYGQIVRGHLSFQLNQTFVGVVMPLTNVFTDEKKAADVIEANESERIVKYQETRTANLVSIVSENNSMSVLVGTSQIRNLLLWNRFDCPIELQRVWMDDVLRENDDLQEVVVHRFRQGIVPVGASLPTISLQISPTLQSRGKLPTSRSYSLMVETNATLHRIQIYVYNGFLTLNSTRGLHNYSVPVYHSDFQTDRREQESTRACLLVPKGSQMPATSRIDGGKVLTENHAVQVCRSLLFNLDKIASHKAHMEIVEVMNDNPVPQTLSIMKFFKNETVDVSIAAEISAAESFSHFPHNTGAAAEVGDKWSNNTNLVSAGDSFVLQPGYRVVFYIKMEAKDILGEFTVPVVSMTTQSEVLHLYARFISVRGTIEPVTPAIVLPAMFPGRVELIQLHYRNTFDHLVTAVKATVSSSELQLLPMRETMAPRQVKNVLDLFFYPWTNSDCFGRFYIVDCLLPLPDPVGEQKCYQLSDYGDFVDEHDLDALRRRDALWSERATTEIYSTSEVKVRLQTNIMDDVAEVTIKALLQRPMVTVPAGIELDPNNESMTVFGRKEFELTELLEVSHIFVHVQNPSNFSIRMELAIAKADRNLFYSCEEEFQYEHRDIDSGVEYPGPDYVSDLCVVEWKTAAANTIARRESPQEIDMPSFYFPKRSIEVSAGEETELGPIYYLPSKVEEVSTKVYVRNDLTHIEPVSLFARSGKGTLKISVNAITDRKSTPSYYTARELAAVIEHEEATQTSKLDGILSFVLSTQDALTNFTQVAEVMLSNTGPYGLIIHSVTVERDDHNLWMQSKLTSDSSPMSDFVVTLDNFNGIPNALAPGEAAKVLVSFCASCVTVDSASWLIIDTSDTVKLIRLDGTISIDAAFACLRSRTPPLSRFTFLAVWMLAVVIAVISISYTIFILTHDAWTPELKLVGKLHSTFDVYSEDSDTKAVKVSAPKIHEEVSTTILGNESSALPLCSLASINRILADMEQGSFVPAACVVMPAVAKLLERRRKDSHSTMRNQSPQNGELSKNNEVGKNNKDGKTTASTAKAKAIGNKTVLAARAQVPASDVAFTTTMTSLRGVEKVVDKADRTDMLPCLTNATHQGHRFKCSSSENREQPSSLEEPPKGFLSSVSSSHSTIAQMDADKSSHSAKFPKSSIDFCGSSHNRNVRSAPAATSSPKKKETPFEAFKSLSERWRDETARDKSTNHSQPALLSGTFLGLEDWNDTLSFDTVAHGLGGPSTAGENRRDENIRPSRSETNRSIGTGAGLDLDRFATRSIPIAAKATPNILSTTATTKAPPGFTPADARPFETRAAFERLRTGPETASCVSSASDAVEGHSLVASNLPLFGPTLPFNDAHSTTLDNACCIGSGRSRLFRGLDVLQDSTK